MNSRRKPFGDISKSSARSDLLFRLAEGYEDRIAHLALALSVGRCVDDLAVEDHRGRTAAVEIHRIYRADAQQIIRKFIKRHPTLKPGCRPSTVTIKNFP